jgi:hypothetical protein
MSLYFASLHSPMKLCVVAFSALAGSVFLLAYLYSQQEEWMALRTWRALLAALLTPAFLGTKIHRASLIIYLLIRISFTCVPAGYCGFMIQMEGVRSAWVLAVYANSCTAILFMESCLLVFWEVKSYADRVLEGK